MAIKLRLAPPIAVFAEVARVCAGLTPHDSIDSRKKGPRRFSRASLLTLFLASLSDYGLVIARLTIGYDSCLALSVASGLALVGPVMALESYELRSVVNEASTPMDPCLSLLQARII